MKRFADNSFVSNEKGAALPSVLIVITILSLMAGMVMAGMVIQSRFIQQDIDALQARYTAEGAAFRFLATDPMLITDGRKVIMPDSSSAVIQSERFGGWLRLTSTATVGGQQKRVQLLIGKPPDPVFFNAVVLGDIRSTLNLAGNTHIAGDIHTGPLGIKTSAFKGKSFEGMFRDSVYAGKESPLPRYDDTFYREELNRYRKMTEDPPPDIQILTSARYRVSQLNRLYSAQTLFHAGDVEIYAEDEAELQDSLTVIAAGNLVLDGELRYRSYTRFIAGGTITVSGNVRGRHGLFAAGEISIEDQAVCSGQFLAGREIRLLNRAYLRYPSILFLESVIEGNRRKGGIELAHRSVLDGVALLPLPESVPVADEARIVVGSQARIRGGLYNTAQTELHGSVLGSAVTFQFYFYDSPTAYINWMKDNTVDVSQRPGRFVMPFGFSDEEGFEIVDWREL